MKNIIIIIKESNREKIEAFLAERQARAKVRTITAEDIIKAAAHVSDKLSIITKTALEGTKASVDLHAQKFPNAYSYTPESTHFWMFYSKGFWRLTDAGRNITRAAGHEYHLTLSQTAKTAVLDAVERLSL